MVWTWNASLPWKHVFILGSPLVVIFGEAVELLEDGDLMEGVGYWE